ncbi:ABC transporter permease [Microtetraspora malaysiensis]|uniref:ABC transporter permease n=1 Tax=Microtetraspora malaysiensis TaxID=161358 RepID=UPI003D8A790D
MSDTAPAIVDAPAADASRPEPRAQSRGALRLGLARAAIELKMFFRERDQVVFVFSFPVIMLVILASIFSAQYHGTQVTVSQVYVTGLIGAGIMAVSFQNLGISIAIERDEGALRRLTGTPMPRGAYFIGKILSVLVIAAVEVAVLLVAGVLFYDVELPASPGPWLTFAWVFMLGLAASALLGIAASSVPRSVRGAPALITVPFVVLQVISGVFIPFSDLPEWLLRLSAVFPLKWLSQGMRSVFLGDKGAVLEVTGGYELGRVALVLAAWVVGGFVLCLLTFRWKSRRDG